MTDDQAPGKDRNFVTALARGLELLRAFEAGEKYLGNGELSSRTGIPKPSVSRLTYTLTQLGYLKFNTHLEKYQLGPGVLALGYRFFASDGIRQLARPYMQELANSTDCAIALGDVDRNAITYLEVCQGTGPLVMRLDAGARLPIVSTAIGRAWLCGLSEPRREAFLAQIRKTDPKQWEQAQTVLKDTLDNYQRYGFVFSEGEWERDISAVAVPLILEGGSEVMAINCGGAALRLTHQVLVDKLGPRLKILADTIQNELKHG
ncbi:MAG: IclR family transcriptional regulator [Natronospirillum sp.]|uniref:IclR family transcriptional regulator n=1 Tax=Natronospirillum sp. TaxID=2812955 RepID=UPI0025CFC114|nr:IclR family transcriptional regulator [Natronospirillum sp.]MCH8552703.1 IclR family transcriptional regulator [Natronospirillum sp.]